MRKGISLYKPNTACVKVTDTFNNTHRVLPAHPDLTQTFPCKHVCARSASSQRTLVKPEVRRYCGCLELERKVQVANQSKRSKGSRREFLF